VTKGAEVEAAVLSVLPASAAGRMHGEAVWLAVMDHVPDAARQEVTAALLRLTAAGEVIRWTRFARPGQGGIERWYRAAQGHGAPAAVAAAPSLFDP
jgi:hypothetical protein